MSRKVAYRLVIGYFIVAVLTTMWPIYPFFSRIRPLILGMPFSMAYLVFLLVLSFLVLVSLYTWERRRDGME
jgi:hypothetical protein